MKKKTQVAMLLIPFMAQVHAMDGCQKPEIIMSATETFKGCEQSYKYFEFKGKKCKIEKVSIKENKLRNRTIPLELTLKLQPIAGNDLILGESALSGLNSDNVRLKVYLEESQSNSINIQSNQINYVILPNNLNYMFDDSSSLTFLSFEGAKCRKCKSMTGMFRGCIRLTDIKWGGLDTSEVTAMDCMFYNCKELESLDLTQFNTSKVRTMRNMFTDCKSLKQLKIDTIDTSRVQNMKSMFSGCELLDFVDFSKFDTKSLQTSEQMFAGCGTLSLINFNKSETTGFNTKNLKDMRSMFEDCYSLTELDLSKFKVGNSVRIDDFIRGCTDLESIRYHTDSKLKMEYAEKQCKYLKNLNKKRFRSQDPEELKDEKIESEESELEDSDSSNSL